MGGALGGKVGERGGFLVVAVILFRCLRHALVFRACHASGEAEG